MATARADRARLFKHPWRVAIVAIALIAVLNLFVILLMESDTTAPGRERLPALAESISPEADELTGLVDDVSVDLRNDLTGVLVIDGVEIPEDQLSRIEELGVITFRPGPDKELRRFAAGEHTVVVRYWPRGDQRPETPPNFFWRFRSAA